MQINIQAPFAVNDALRALITEKIEKLTTYFDRIYKADVYLKTKENNTPNGKTVEIILHIPGKDAFAKSTEDTIEKAVAAVADKLEKQLKKRKEILAQKY